MTIIWDVLKKTMLFGWEEIIYLVIFNIVTLTALVLGPALVFIGVNKSVALMALGSMAMFAAPPALFGLFWLTYQISLGNAVKFSTYVDGARQYPKAAYIWGGVNMFIVVMLISNIIFYQSLAATWAGFAAVFFDGLLIVWVVLQLLTLALYPHLVEPSFRLAMKNALVLVAVNPFAVVGMAVIAVGGVLLGLYVPVLLGLISVSLAALVVSVTVDELIALTKSRD